MTAQHRNSKGDTVYFADTSVASINTDLSQELVSLTAAGDHAFEAASARTAIVGEREVTVSIEIRDTDSRSHHPHSRLSSPIRTFHHSSNRWFSKTCTSMPCGRS